MMNPHNQQNLGKKQGKDQGADTIAGRKMVYKEEETLEVPERPVFTIHAMHLVLSR